MTVTIKSIDGKDLYVAQNAADVRAALEEAASKGADLFRADLFKAVGFDPRRCNDLLMLLDQPGAIRAYKLVSADYGSPIQTDHRLIYKVGKTLKVAKPNTAPTVLCGAGINVATLPWVMREWSEGKRILLVEFTAADIAAIPVGDGKFRVRKVTVIRELDLVELGLVAKPEEATA